MIEPRLRQSEIERAVRKPTESLDAYDLYLRALTLRDQHTDESVHDAISLLKQALAIDPSYAPAAALIGWSRVHQRSHGRTPVSEAEAAEAIALAKQALEVGKDDADALWMASATLQIFAGEYTVAAAATDRALALSPNSAHAWMARGYVTFHLDQSGPAIEALETAMRLSPLDSLRRTFTNGIALAHLAAGRFELALDWVDRTLREEPGYRGALISKVVACAHLNRLEEARAALRLLIDSLPGLTIARYKALWLRAYSYKTMAIFVEGVRKAGLPDE